MLSIAIIGTGGVARKSAEALKKVRGCQLVACCDVHLAKARDFAHQFDVPSVFSSYDDLFERGDFDAVINMTPDHLHYEVNMAAVSHGVHLLSEKPLADSHRKTRKLLQAAEEQASKIHMVHFEKRYSGPVLKAKQLIEEDKLGNILHVEASYLQSWLTTECGGDWKEDESLLWKLSGEKAHSGVIDSIGLDLLDTVTYLAGDVKKAHCLSRSFHKGVHGNKLKGIKLDSIDSAVIMAEMKSDALSSLHISRVATGEADNLFIALYGDLGSLKIRVQSDGQVSLEICKGNDRHNAQWKAVAIPEASCSAQNFVQAIKNGALPESAPDMEHVAQYQRIIEKSQETD